MFSSKSKLDNNLKYYVSKNAYKNYRVLIKYKNFHSSLAKKVSSYKGKVYHIIGSINIISADLTARGIERIIEYPEIEKIYLDEYLFLCGMSISTANKTHLSSNSKLSGAGVGVGVIDSGVYPHQDLIKPSNRIELFIDVINELTHPYDDNGHGTCIAGILCSNGTESNDLYKGICHKSKLFCYKAFDKLGKGFASDVLYSLEHVISISEKNNIKVLCLPFELLSHNTFIISLFDSMLNKAITKGLIPVLPSGSLKDNYSIMGISTLSNCITVGGLDTTSNTLRPYEYSSGGLYEKAVKPDLSAACVNIVSLNCDQNYISEKNGLKLYPHKLDAAYKTFSGTSLSTAYISGLCALICEKNPKVNFKDVLSLLKVACTPIENISKSIQGEGVVDTKKLML